MEQPRRESYLKGGPRSVRPVEKRARFNSVRKQAKSNLKKIQSTFGEKKMRPAVMPKFGKVKDSMKERRTKVRDVIAKRRAEAGYKKRKSALGSGQRTLRAMKERRRAGGKVDQGKYNRQINVVNKARRRVRDKRQPIMRHTLQKKLLRREGKKEEKIIQKHDTLNN